MNVQDLIGEVAKRHNVLVDPHDPIFVAVTLNELLLAEHVRKMQAAIDRGEKATALASARQLELTKHTATELIAESSRHAANQVRAAGSGVRTQLQQLVEQLAAQSEGVVAETVRQRRAAQTAAVVAIGCACLTFAMAVVAWLRPL